MTKNKSNINRLISILAVSLLLVGFVYLPSHVHADTLAFTADMNWDEAGCTGIMNGVVGSNNPGAYEYGVASGDTVNLTINNQASVSMTVSSQTPYFSYDIPAKGSQNVTLTNLQGWDPIGGQSDSTKCTSLSNASLFIEPGMASLACSLTNGNTEWDITGTSSSTVNNPSLYEGSGLISASPISPSGTINFTTKAYSGGYIFSLYNGPNNTSRLLATAACTGTPVATASSPPANNSTTSTGTSKSTGTSTTNSSPTNTSNAPSPSSASATPSDTTHSTNTTTLTISPAATNTTSKKTSFMPVIIVVVVALLFFLFELISVWKVLKKASRHGWIAIIPIYNIWVIYEISGFPGWWAIMQIIPIVNLVALVMFIIAMVHLAKRFGKGGLFGVFGLFIFGFIGWPILAFGKPQYNNPDNLSLPSATPTANKRIFPPILPIINNDFQSTHTVPPAPTPDTGAPNSPIVGSDSAPAAPDFTPRP
jgi:hypothetical protein